MTHEFVKGCHQPDIQISRFCPAIQQLMEEHLVLIPIMKQIYNRTESIQASELDTMRKEVEAFMDQLEKHSYKEEAYLFETLAKYVGSDSGPIAVMEYEHHTAKAYLNRFLFEIEDNEDAVQTLRSGVELLEEHFEKEEKVLFPMAEHLLNQEEKLMLEKHIL